MQIRWEGSNPGDHTGGGDHIVLGHNHYFAYLVILAPFRKNVGHSEEHFLQPLTPKQFLTWHLSLLVIYEKAQMSSNWPQLTFVELTFKPLHLSLGDQDQPVLLSPKAHSDHTSFISDSVLPWIFLRLSWVLQTIPSLLAGSCTLGLGVSKMELFWDGQFFMKKEIVLSSFSLFVLRDFAPAIPNWTAKDSAFVFLDSLVFLVKRLLLEIIECQC